MAKINAGTNNGKEYLVSIGSGSTAYTELYDFDNDIIYQKSYSDILANQNDNIRGTSSTFKSSSGDYYSIFGHYCQSNSYFFLLKYKFTDIDINNNAPTKNYYYNTDVVGQKLSCYISDSNKIICFYTYKYGNYKYGYIKIFSEDPKIIGGTRIEYVYTENEAFLKCIYFKDEIGIFVYYYYYNKNGNTINPQNPKILFKGYTCTTSFGNTNCNINDYSDNFKETILDQKIFNMNI